MKECRKNTVSQNEWLKYLLSFLFIVLFSCEETTGPGSGTDIVSRKILIYSDKSSIPANGGSAQILVKVYAGDDTTAVVSGVRIQFSSSQAGTSLYIPAQNDITDANGYARATLYASSRSGTAGVTASIENFSNTLFVSITQGSGLLSADPVSILADGISQSTITASVIDSLGQPQPGAQVSFTTTNGTITPYSYSDQNGHALATLLSSPSVTDISSSITATTVTGKISVLAAKPAATENTDQSEKTDGLLGSTAVVFKGITIKGAVDKTTVFANSVDSTLVSISVTETTSKAPVAGATVNFASNLGKVRTSSTLTDSQGAASVVFFGDNVSGTAVFIASISEGLKYTSEFFLTKQMYMTLVSDPPILSANGTDIATIKAILKDDDNNPVQGETVYFSSTLGTILPSGVTSEWGEATASLRSPRLNGIAHVTARFGSIERSLPVEFTGADISILASPLILVANGETMSKLTITIIDASSSSIVDNVVSLSTSLGTLHTADLQMSGVSIVDSTSTDGKITAYLSSDESGDAVVTVSTPGLQETINIHFTDYTFTLTVPESEVLAGGDSLYVTASLKDKDGNILPITSGMVSFSPTLGSISNIREDESGNVLATLISGNTAGQSTITASISDPKLSASTSVLFVAADIGTLVLEATKNSVRVGGNEINILAKAYDLTGNPKPGETITFSIIKSPGGGEKLDSGSAETNEVGQAIITFISGMSGSEQNGVEILGRAGNISDTIYLTITGQPDTVLVGFDSSNYTDNADGTYSLLVSAIVSDVNRNKVVDGTIVYFSLIGDVGVIDPEISTVGGVATANLLYSPSDAGKSVFVSASSGGKQDIKTILLPGSVGTVATLTVSPKKTSLIADGISTTTFTVFLAGTEGEPLSNRTVYSTADVGHIQPSAITADPAYPNASPGKASISFTSEALTEDQISLITFTSGGISGSATVNLKGVSLSTTIDPETLPSDGQSTAQINVLVKEKTSNIPISNATVSFGATDGNINGSAVTNANGVASTTYTSGYTPGPTNVYITYGAVLIDTVTVQINAVMARGIDLFASPTQIAANGISTSTISALLRDDNFNPIIGEVIRFSTNLGTVTAADSTDVNGRAEVRLVSERRNGEATVTATFKEHITKIPVKFTGVNLSASATPENLFAGGDESTTVTAYVKDAAELAIVGESVEFEWLMDGVVQGTNSITTDVQGRASINLSSIVAGQTLIRVQAAGAVDSTYVTFTPMMFTIDGDAQSVSTGGDSLLVWAQLYDTVNEIYIEGAEVEFNTTLGTITNSSTTNSDGKAFAYISSGMTAGEFTISASTELNDYRVSADKQFTFTNADPDMITLQVDANIVQIGGNSSALIALVMDKFGNPVSNALVSFKILSGPSGGERIHPATVTTGLSGAVTTYFYSGQTASEYEAVVLQAEVNNILSNESKLTIAGAPETIRPSFDADWILSGINNGNGTYTLPISATVLDVNSNGVVDGTTVYFKIEPGEGAVLSPVKTVNSVAVSSITYPSASAGREVLLTASAGGKEGSITFSLPGFAVSYLSVTAAPKTIPADGRSTTQIKASLFDKNGSSTNVPDGTTVSFTTNGGTLDPIVSKTEDGIAVTTLTSDRVFNNYVEIMAQTGIFQAWTFVYFEEIGSSVNQVDDIVVTASPDTIDADGISSAVITATLSKFDGSPVTTPTTVTFESDIGQITNFVRSDSLGVATASFLSGEVGSATITASVGNISGFASINVTPGVPQSVELSFSPSFVNVQGSGMNETLLITSLIKDSKNNPVEDGTLVKFELVGAYDSGSSLTPEGDNVYESIPIPTLNGLASVAFHSGTRAGALRVKATIIDSSGDPYVPSITSETTQFLVYSGPAYLDLTDTSDPFTESRMTIYSDPTNIFAREIGTVYNSSTITATIADKYNNPVPAGTAVYFTTTGGYITTATGFTDDNGMASVTLYGGNPLPTLTNSAVVTNPNSDKGGPASFTLPKYDFDGNGFDNDGIAYVIATTEGRDHLNRNVTVWNYAPVVFSQQVNTFTITPAALTVYQGESTVLTIRLYDFNGNPVVGTSSLAISTTLGTISNQSITTANPGQTTYYVTLSNDLDPLTDTSGSATVSVELTSPNGDYLINSIPIFLSTSIAP